MSEANNISTSLSGESRPELAEKLATYQRNLKSLAADASEMDRALIQLDISEVLLALDQKEEAWNEARATFDVFIKNEAWQRAVEACNVMYQTEQPASIVALGHGDRQPDTGLYR